jgi:HSP20 family protein
MVTLLPALRSGSLLRPFLGEFFSELDQINRSTTSWPDEVPGFKMDVAEHKDRYVIKADLAGICRDGVEITLNKSWLLIEVKPKPEVEDSSNSQARYIVRERRIGAMSRAILLPYVPPEQNVEASMNDGVLTITVKKDVARMPKKIAVH